MEIIQKKRGIKHIFTYEEGHFNFAYQDRTGSGDIDVNYGDFPTKSSTQIVQNDWLRNVGFLWCALGLFQIGYAIYSNAPLSGKGFWIMIGAACIAWAYFSKIKYSVFQTERGNILVIQDKNHDRIVSKLKSRRKSQLLSWYGDINPENDLQQEIAKFKWLKEQKIISEQDAEQKIAQAELLHRDNYTLPGEEKLN
jgi:hypothetical protein